VKDGKLRRFFLKGDVAMPLVGNTALACCEFEDLRVFCKRVLQVWVSGEFPKETTECNMFIFIGVLLGKKEYLVLQEKGEQSFCLYGSYFSDDNPTYLSPE
jgi:hypothetical protein